MRMPPGWDGVETITELWKVDPQLQVVICTAFSDYTWAEIVDRLGQSDKLLILKKPFDSAEVSQLASALIEKRRLGVMAATRMSELEEMVQKRTEKLKESVERARQANHAKSQFLANMSHELRTPLTAILGYADTFLGGKAGGNLREEQQRAVSTICKSGEHLLSLINGILDLSKIEAGKLIIEQVVCSPRELAEEVASTMHVQAGIKDIVLTLSVSDDVPVMIESDPVRIKQVLLNLVGNAIKFTSVGGVIVELTTTTRDGEPKIQFIVTDSGIGIAPDKMELVFKPFRQADGSTTRNYGGTGLGLTVSRQLAQRMGGDITVSSHPGKGSTFTVELPLGEIPEELQSAKRRLSRRSEAITDAKVDVEKIRLPYRILLAEDEKLNQHFVSVMLRRVGAEVEIADNGQVAVEKAISARDDGHPYDLILMDMQMPVLDGYSASTKLRESGYNIPIIALTAHAMERDRKKCIDAGCSDYATKPIKREKLFPLILRWAEHHATEAQGALMESATASLS